MTETISSVLPSGELSLSQRFRGSHRDNVIHKRVAPTPHWRGGRARNVIHCTFVPPPANES